MVEFDETTIWTAKLAKYHNKSIPKVVILKFDSTLVIPIMIATN